MSDKSYQSYGYSGSTRRTKEPMCGYNCLCDSCCKKAAEKRGDWYNTSSAREQNRSARGRK